MNAEVYVSKIALDKNGKKLGTVIEVQESPAFNGEVAIYIIVQKSFLFKPSIHVSFKVSKIKKIDEDFVWVDVLKSNFDAWVKQLINHREQQAKVIRTINT